ncbi:MAG: tryptophan 7-halogenase [Roseiflexaceae bacterium]
MAQETLFDIVVLGGGPAGAAAALALARTGCYRVLLVERSAYDAPRIGETLSPGARNLLIYLGVWEQFLADGHQPAFGTMAAWGSPELFARDFIFTPFGHGWHLDRQRFDAMLARTAEAAGASLWCNTLLHGCAPGPGGGWRLYLRRNGAPVGLSARCVLDAGGRAAGLARRLGARSLRIDRLVGLAGLLHFPQGLAPDTNTLVEGCPDGWWYSARLPGDMLIVALMSDPDLLRQRGLLQPEAWRAALARMPYTAARATGGVLAGRPRIYPAHSARLEQPFGPGWAAAGDAACSHDPLSSSGIPRALDSGVRAARGLDIWLRHGDNRELHAYAELLRQQFDQYLASWLRYYRMEQRWPDAPFWQRRHALAGTMPHTDPPPPEA